MILDAQALVVDSAVLAERRARRFARGLSDGEGERPELVAAEAVVAARRRALVGERAALLHARTRGAETAARAEAALEARIAHATAALAGEIESLRAVLAAERSTRSSLEARLAAERAARAAAERQLELLRGAAPDDAEPVPRADRLILPGLQEVAARLAASPAITDEPPPPSPVRLTLAPPRPTEAATPLVPSTATPEPTPPASLRLALVRLAQDDPQAAGRLIAGLLPALGALTDARVNGDFAIRRVGTFAVTTLDGRAHVRALERPRPRRGPGGARFLVDAEAEALAELLAGTRRRVGRFGRRARMRGKAKALAPLRHALRQPHSLAGIARAGARLDPAAVLRAAQYAIPPTWTRGHSFTVAHELLDDPPETVYVTALDGRGVTVGARHAHEPDAIVRLTRDAFGHLLRREPVPAGARPAVRGDAEAVAVLRLWLDRCAGD